MSTPNHSADPASVADRLRAATAALEALTEDWTVLDELDDDERQRLVNAAGAVFSPDVQERRRRTRARQRAERAAKLARDEGVLADTGIRVLRSRPVFVTPNPAAPAYELSGEAAERVAAADREAAAADDAGDREVRDPQHCYVCKQKFTRVHHFYDQMCGDCGDFNYAKRTESADLRGRVALLTGGRVKIGYQAGIKLLRAGAHLIVTTRFPRDSAARYAAEPDFADWADRLEIFGLDLRHTPSVEAFCEHLLRTRDRLDFIVSNACQTVRRPPDFYRHMMAMEDLAADELTGPARALLGSYEGLRAYDLLGEAAAVPPPSGPGRATDAGAPALGGVGVGTVGVGIGAVPGSPVLVGLTHAAQLSQAELLPDDVGGAHLFPTGRLDQDLQQVDLRDRNSWRLTLAEVSSVELLETQLVNAVAPFVLNARLKPLMLRSPERDKHIVNVSAVEGQFYRRFKTTRHPHTNMAKAALNMMTRTSAADYQADGIHMNSVDTGWVSDEDPLSIAERKAAEHRFRPPLDIVDGAARIVDPIIAGFNSGEHVWGAFLKDYKPTDW